MRNRYYDREKHAHDFFEMLTEYFWFHDDTDIQKSFQVYTRFREEEEDRHPGEALQESTELLEKEKAFSSLLQGLDVPAYQLWRKAMEQSKSFLLPRHNRHGIRE